MKNNTTTPTYKDTTIRDAVFSKSPSNQKGNDLSDSDAKIKPWTSQPNYGSMCRSASSSHKPGMMQIGVFSAINSFKGFNDQILRDRQILLNSQTNN